MNRKLFLPVRWLICISSLALLTLQGFAQPEYNPDWARSFRIGVMAGFNIKANLRMNGTFGVSGSRAPGVYDDGYVLKDSTGNLDGHTWNWGYQNSSQWDSDANRLYMHSTTSFEEHQSADGLKDEPYIGFDMAYGGILWHRNRIRVGWELGFGFLPIAISDSTPANVSVTRSRVYFDVPAGVILPTAPYLGTYNGPGAVISDAPHSVSGTDTASAALTGTRKLDVTLYTFKLGPTFFWDVNRYMGLQVGAGGAFGLVSGDLKFDETLTFSDTSNARNSGSVGGTDMTYGGYVNALVTFHLVKNGDVYIGAQYMPMGKVSIGGGGRHGELDLKGQIYVSAGINWPF